MGKSEMCVCKCGRAQICESHHFLGNAHAAAPELKARNEEVISPPNLLSIIAVFPVFVVSIIPIR
jgi:hypothetical protein